MNEATDSDLPALSGEEFALLAQFRYALRRFLSYSEDAARVAGITPQHYQALLALRGLPAGSHPTIGELAERLRIRHHSVVGLVDRLVSQELMVRRPSLDDRRLVHVALTERGAAFLDQLASGHLAQLRRLAPEMIDLLEKLRSSEPAEPAAEVAGPISPA